MIRAILHRLGYLRFLLRPACWRWAVHRLDYMVQDHLEPAVLLVRDRSGFVHPSVSFRSPRNVVLGRETRLQPGCIVWASPRSTIRIGDYSGLGPGTQVYSSNHRFEPGVPYYRQAWNEADVVIGRDVWVGGRCVILPGVTIGDGSVVAAGSVVTRDVPPGSVVAGAPARVLRRRTSPDSAGADPATAVALAAGGA